MPANLLDFDPGKLVAPFIVGMTSMTLEPLPNDAVPGSDLIKLPPQVVILDGFTVDGAPIVGFPT